MENIKDICVNQNMCLYTSPCQHYVKILYKDGISEELCWSGVKIYKILQELGKEIPIHFKEYKDLARFI